MALSNPVYSLLRRIERGAAWAQGKGYGEASIAKEVACVLACLRRCPILAVDIGANVGEYSAKLLQRCADVELHLFEPSPTNLEALNARFARQVRVTINACAVAEHSGRATLFADQPGSALASLAPRRVEHHGLRFDHQESVATLRFESYWEQTLRRRALDIVKLDIEGHELAALRGFGSALAATRVIQFEFGGGNIDSRTFFQDFHYFFRDHGFALWRVTPLGLQQIERYRESDESFTTTNLIAVNGRAAQAAASGE